LQRKGNPERPGLDGDSPNSAREARGRQRRGGVDLHRSSGQVPVAAWYDRATMSRRASGRSQPDRIRAVEGCNGIGQHLAQRQVADGETVLDVPAKFSAQARVFSTGQGHKTDVADAHSGAVVAPRTRPAADGRRRPPGRTATAGRPTRRTGPGPHPQPSTGRTGCCWS
jgi:hypothetical protein